METSANYRLLGTFVLAAVVIGIGFFYFLAPAENDTIEYDVVFNERVSGLSEGSDVRFNGIKIGEIRTLKLAPNNPEQVVARVRVERDAPIKVDTQAEIELVGVTGLAIIQFTGGKPESLLLRDVSRQRIPRIVAKPSAIADIIDGGTNIIAGAQRVLDEKNTDTLARILEDIEIITDSLASREEEIGLLFDNASAAAEDFAVFAESLSETSDSLETVIVSMEQVFNRDVPQSIIEFDIAVADAQLLMTQLNGLLDENREAIEAFTQQGLGEATGIMADSRRLIRTLDGMLREVERDPTRFFFGDTRPEAVN
ncbi:MAG: MlaD family protein [Aquisalinus sp.]|nr:MlaD family protein [Aquisalinus sp.]